MLHHVVAGLKRSRALDELDTAVIGLRRNKWGRSRLSRTNWRCPATGHRTQSAVSPRSRSVLELQADRQPASDRINTRPSAAKSERLIRSCSPLPLPTRSYVTEVR